MNNKQHDKVKNRKNLNKKTLLLQIERYLKNEITKEQYADITEPFYSKYAKHIETTEFYRIFRDNIPDACIVYADEPGGKEMEKDSEFRAILQDTYEKLIEL